MPSATNFFKTITCVVLLSSGLTWDNILQTQRILQDAAWSVATRKSRSSQLTCYNRFCAKYELRPFPCPASQACFYVAFLSNLLSPKSVSNYLSAMWAHQRSMGLQTFPDDYALRLTLRGLRRLGRSSRPARHPLSAQELLMIFQEVFYPRI